MHHLFSFGTVKILAGQSNKPRESPADQPFIEGPQADGERWQTLAGAFGTEANDESANRGGKRNTGSNGQPRREKRQGKRYGNHGDGTKFIARARTARKESYRIEAAGKQRTAIHNRRKRNSSKNRNARRNNQYAHDARDQRSDDEGRKRIKNKQFKYPEWQAIANKAIALVITKNTRQLASTLRHEYRQLQPKQE